MFSGHRIGTNLESSAVKTAVEPLSLRLPKDLLVLQPMQGHLDLEPLLLVPGLRCAIGSAEGCAVRLTNSDLVQPEHCVIEVTARQTMLTAWVPETTWLNDRLVIEPRELIPGDRVSLGPFDFRLRLASAEELLYAKLIDRDVVDQSQFEDVLRIKRAIDKSGRDPQPEPDLFSSTLQNSSNNTDSESHEQLTQHISKLLGDLQSQVLALQEREADLSEQLRQQRHTETLSDVPYFSGSNAQFDHSVRTEYEQGLQLLQAERDQLERERAEFAIEQSNSHHRELEWMQQLEALESQLTDIEYQRSMLAEEKSICRALAEELLRDKAQIEDWSARLRSEERVLVTRKKELEIRDQERAKRAEVSLPSGFSTTQFAQAAIESTKKKYPDEQSSTAEIAPNSGRPIQTFLTLIAFGAAALFLGTNLGDPAAISVIGWATALVGAISTVDLLFHRCFTASR